MWQQVASLFLAKPGDPRAVARRVGVVIALMGLAFSLALAGIGAAMWGLIALLAMWLPQWAAILIAGALAVAIAAVALYGRLPHHKDEQRLVEAIVARFPVESVVVAAAAGFVFARFPEVRSLIVKQLVAR